MAGYSISVGDSGGGGHVDGVCVLIDVLRASSTIVTALANGVGEVIPVDAEETAFELREEGCVIAGEREGVKSNNFDIGNSPVELLQYLKRSDIERLALTTTNSTKILTGLDGALISSSLNLSAVRNRLEKTGESAEILAVGSRHGVTEDLAVAMALYSSLNDGIEIDGRFLARSIQQSRAARYLGEIGYAKDVLFISQIDRYDVVPVLEDGVIRRGDTVVMR